MTEEHPPTVTVDIPAELGDTRPTVKLVYLLVDANAPLTFGALQRATHLHHDPLRSALDDLIDRGVIVEGMAESQRQSVYRACSRM